MLEAGAKKMEGTLGGASSKLIDPQRIANAAAELGTVAGGATAVFSALGIAGKKVYEFTRESAQLEYASTKFDNLSTSIKTTSGLLLNDMRQATHGLYSDAQLIQQGGQIMALGLADTNDEVVRLSRVAGALNMDMDQLTLTLTNQTTRRFDTLGVSTDGFKEKLKQLENQGYSTEAAFQEAFLQQAEKQIRTVGDVADSDYGAFLKAEAATSNFFNTVKRGREDALVPYLNTYTKLFNIQSRANELMTSGENTYYRSAMAQAAVEAGREWQQPERKSEFGRTGDDVAVASSSMLSYASDMGVVLDVGLKLSEATEDYTMKLDGLNQKLNDTALTYGENSAKAMDLRGQIETLSSSYTSAFDQMALKTLQMKDATDQMQLDFALASGQITQGGYDQAVMMDKLASAYIGGQLNANQYAAAVGEVGSMVAGLNGMSSAAYIDVYIRVHGTMPGVFTGPSSGFVGGGSGFAGSGSGRALGGPVNPNTMYEVNEGGAPEILSVGGKTFLMMGGKSGHVTPAGRGESGGSSSADISALASRIPSAAENAKALARELSKYWS